MKTDSKLNQFENYSINNLNVIFGGLTNEEDDDGGNTDKKKLQVPTQGNDEGEEESDSN